VTAAASAEYLRTVTLFLLRNVFRLTGNRRFHDYIFPKEDHL